MRSLILLAVVPAAMFAASLKVENPAISQMEGGDPDAPGWEHVAGETIYFSCRVSGFTKSPDNRMHLTYTIQALDAKGIALAETDRGDVNEEVLPQDKDWMPKISSSMQVPPLVFPGEFKIVVKVHDALSNTDTESSTPFRVRGRSVAPSDKLAIRNLNFYRSEEDSQPLLKPVYRNGTSLAVKFDVVGFKYGDKNKIDVSYLASILGADGRQLWKQPDPAVEQSDSFYPKPYVPEFMGLSLETVKPADYTLVIQVKDAIGNQTAEIRQVFTVQ